MRQSRDTGKWDKRYSTKTNKREQDNLETRTNGTKDTARRQTKENETIYRHGQMGQKTQHENKQKRMRQSRDTGK